MKKIESGNKDETNNKKVKKEPVVKENNETMNDEIFNKKIKRHGIYLSYKMRIVLLIIFILFFIFTATFLLTKSFAGPKLLSVNYIESSDIDYRVYLEENDYFNDEYLPKDMTYVSNLIKNITIDFNYKFDIEKLNNFNVDYSVVGKLIITNQKDGKLFLEKDYTLLDSTKEEIKNSNSYTLNKEVVVDYNYFNNLATSFKRNYGVDSESNLKVYLVVKEKSIEQSSYDFDNTNTMLLNIPLTEKAVNIKLDYNNLNENKKILVNEKPKLNDYYSYAVATALLIITVDLVYRLFSLVVVNKQKKSDYDKYIEKILREYDRLIVNTKTAPDKNKMNIIKIDSFQELLDARDNVKDAIKYYVVAEHQKCNFYFTNGKELYLLVIKAVDINKK